MRWVEEKQDIRKGVEQEQLVGERTSIVEVTNCMLLKALPSYCGKINARPLFSILKVHKVY